MPTSTARSGEGATETNLHAGGMVFGEVFQYFTPKPAQDLMNRLFEIEKDMGRIRNRHWESRVIDLDMLLFGSDIIHEQGLTVPHPLMHKRRFVLAPMVDLAPDLKHPSFEKTMFELLQAIPEDKQIVKPIENR